MKTERKLALALKSMMAKYPLDEISVVKLTDKCHINRQSFYYHFHDIYDLLTLLFLDERIEGIDRVKNEHEMLEAIYHYYDQNTAFVDATIKSAAKDLFGEFVFNNCYQCFTRFIESVELSKKLDKNHKKNIVRYYSSAFCSLIMTYLETTKNKSLKGLLSLFDFLSEGEVARSVQVLIQKNLKGDN